MTTLKICAANEINGAQASGHGPTGIYPNQIGCGNLTRIALSKIQTSKLDLKALQQQRKQRTSRACRQSETNRCQHRPDQFQTFLNVPAHQQLLRGTPAEIKTLSRGTKLGHLKISFCRFGRASGICECLGKSAFEID